MPIAVGDDGLVGVAVRGCARILDAKSMKRLDGLCRGWRIRSASYSSDVFGFLSFDEFVYLFKHGKFWKLMKVGGEHDGAIAILPDGFVACNWRCARYTFDGEKLWDVRVSGNVLYEPAVHAEHVYATNTHEGEILILRLEDGRIVGKVGYGTYAKSIVSCKDYLAAIEGGDIVWGSLRVYDISGPVHLKELWRVERLRDPYDLAFSPDCSIIAVADWRVHKLKFFDTEGRPRGEVEYERRPQYAAWGEDVLAVELDDRVLLYSFSSLPE